MNEMSMQTESSEFNRRDFLKGSSFATLMTMLGGVQLFAQTAPETPELPTAPPKKVKVALVGLGNWGRDILDQLGRLGGDEKILAQPEIVAICDSYPAMVRRSSSKAPDAAKVEDYK